MMEWVKANLLWIAIGGCLVILFSFIQIGRREPPNWKLFVVGLFALGVSVCLAIAAAIGPPTDLETEPDRPRPTPRPPIPATALERLRQSWDSEETADWPVAETLATLSLLEVLPI